MVVVLTSSAETKSTAERTSFSSALLTERACLMYEVFDPRDGAPLYRVRWRWMAKLLTRFMKGTDYNRINEGWL
jgi:hypothetical protein